MQKQSQKPKVGLLENILNKIEKIGNKLPDPVSIFAILSILVFLISLIASKYNVSVIHPSTNESISVVNLLSKEQLRLFLAKIVPNFQGFAPLGLVLVTMLGAGVTEKTGLMEVLMKQSVNKVPKKLLTITIIFAGIVANAAADAGFIVLPPLAALVFMSVGRHPLVGMFAAYAGVAAGFSANIMVSMIDVLLAGFTGPSAQMIEKSYIANPAMNMYFLAVSAVVLSLVGGFITEKYIAPRFEGHAHDGDASESNAITDIQLKGLKYSILSLVLVVLVIIGLSIGKSAFFVDETTGSILSNNSTLMQGMVPIITILFLVPGLVYGVVTKSIKNDKDLVSIMGSSMSDMGMYIVLAFAAGQFLYLFNASNLGVVLSIKGALSLQSAGITGKGLIVAFILFASFVNLFIGSASAKWAIMAPIFVPMFLILGYDPALTQVAYRIGDSITNPLSPLFPYFPVLLAFAKKYDKNIGMGTVIANMLPYSVSFGVVWIILLLIFMVFNLPLGPGGGIYFG